MRGRFALAVVSLVALGHAVDVGILDNSRLYSSGYNVQTGSFMTTMKGMWEERGAVWHPTSALTPAFLSTVSVFYTSQVGPPELSADEQAALLAWVRAGNTLIVTGDCS